MGLSWQEYWSGFSFPPPGDLPNPGIGPASPALAGGCFTFESPGKHLIYSLYQLEFCKKLVYVCVCSRTHTCVFVYYEGLAHIILGASTSKICRAGWQLETQEVSVLQSCYYLEVGFLLF